MSKVSIIMPACNVETFLRECMDSVVNQTLKDIEIICVDDGSKDSTGAILDEYAAKDERIKVIHKVNTGYGNSMNVGLDHATGEYVGVIETDDWADLDMFEKLYAVAKENDADVVKSNYYTYVTNPEPKSTYFEVLAQYDNYDKVFYPLEFQDVYRVRPSIWTGLYRRKMLVDNKVRFNETPGASYQDTGFAFKVWTSANRAVLVKDAYLHYRTDNANSSVKSTAKIFCLCEEYQSIDSFLDMYPEKKERLRKLEASLKYESYRWNYERLSLEFKYCFLLQMKSELEMARQAGDLDEAYFRDFQWRKLMRILDDTDAFYKESCVQELAGQASVSDLAEAYTRMDKRVKKLEKEIKSLKKDDKKLKDENQKIKSSTSYKVGRAMMSIPRTVKRHLKGDAK